MHLPRLYPILDQGALDARGEDLSVVANELRHAGVELLQYRAKLLPPQGILHGAAVISEAFRGSRCLLVMNDRADLALLAGWPGVHVGQGDLPVEAARRVLCGGASGDLRAHSSREKPLDEWGTQSGGDPDKCFVGVSTHTDQQVRLADAGSADYIAVGPVFATGTKADAEPVIGLDGVRRARALTAKPLVAIGGITRVNALSVVDAGADSVAVIGALFAPGERPGKVAEEFLRILR